MERKEEKEREEGDGGSKKRGEKKRRRKERRRRRGGGGKGRMRMRPGGSKLTEFFILQTQTFQHFKPFVNLGRMYRYTLFLATHTPGKYVSCTSTHLYSTLQEQRERILQS